MPVMLAAMYWKLLPSVAPIFAPAVAAGMATAAAGDAGRSAAG